MQARSPLPPAAIQTCRAEMLDFAVQWRRITRTTHPAAKAEAEVQVFNQMVVALQGRFANLQTAPLSPPLAEVHLLAQGVAANGGYLPSDHTAGWPGEGSITGYRAGQKIALTEATFLALADAFLSALTQDRPLP